MKAIPIFFVAVLNICYLSALGQVSDTSSNTYLDIVIPSGPMCQSYTISFTPNEDSVSVLELNRQFKIKQTHRQGRKTYYILADNDELHKIMIRHNRKYVRKLKLDFKNGSWFQHTGRFQVEGFQRDANSN